MAEISYTKTNWVNNVTKLNADNMNHIENGIEALYEDLKTKLDKSNVVQATGQSTTAVMSQKATTDEINALKSDIGTYNLVNTVEISEGYINKNNGELTTNVSGFHCSDYIEIGWLNKIRVKRTFHYGGDGLVFYNKDKKYISGYGERTGTNYVVLDVPENAVYIRLSGFLSETLEVYPNDVFGLLYNHNNRLLELKEKLEKNRNILESQIKDTIISDLKNISLGRHMFKQDDKIVVNYPAGDGNSWWAVPVILEKTKNNIVNLHFEITDLAEGNSVDIYKSFTNTKGQLQYIMIKKITENGIYDIPFDVNYSIVYEGLDTTKGISMLGSNGSSPCSYVCINPILYDVSTLLDTEKNLGENLNTMVEDISSNKNDIIALKSKTNGVLVSPNGSKFLMQISDNGEIVAVPKIPSNILYVGNSLLLGFGTFGMASSNSNEDYYHYVNEYLISLGKTLSTDRLQGSGYEGTTSSDEQDTWLNTHLLPKLNNSLQLVIIQLGDNVNTEERVSAFEEGAKKLIRFVRKYAPNTRVAWVGEWYSSSIKQTYISNACVECGATFIDISKLPNVSGNQSYVGAKYVTDDGVEHEITNSGVASHPSSQGMRQIADVLFK